MHIHESIVAEDRKEDRWWSADLKLEGVLFFKDFQSPSYSTHKSNQECIASWAISLRF